MAAEQMVAATVTDGDVRRENESGGGERKRGDEERFDKQREKGHCWIVRRVEGERRKE